MKSALRSKYRLPRPLQNSISDNHRRLGRRQHKRSGNRIRNIIVRARTVINAVLAAARSATLQPMQLRDQPAIVEKLNTEAIASRCASDGATPPQTTETVGAWSATQTPVISYR